MHSPCFRSRRKDQQARNSVVPYSFKVIAMYWIHECCLYKYLVAYCDLSSNRVFFHLPSRCVSVDVVIYWRFVTLMGYPSGRTFFF